MSTIKPVDKPFLISTIVLVVVGLLIFISASMGLWARGESGPDFFMVAFKQIFFGVFLGLVAMTINSRIDYKFWKKNAFWIFFFAILINLLVFVPHIGLLSGGARRWIIIGNFTLQPSEILKIGFIIYFASWLSGVKNNLNLFRFGLLPFVVILGIVGLILLNQPDTATFFIIFASGLAMYLISGAKWRDIFILFLISAIGLFILASMRPYLMDRLTTYINPSSDPLHSGYQIQQSLIAIGSGGTFGRGFGQSVQKFNYLPEPIGDSIFAVAAEEFGFVGSVLLISLYIFFALRGLKIANDSSDEFGRLVTVGIVILIISESFINIGSMLGVLPLSGIPLFFVSHGGTALLFVLFSVGIVLNVSRHQIRN
ncbi:MAG: putative peptidoglycan glycosyltransferase FtsW [Candidatus Paceibacterota bacterium]